MTRKLIVEGGGDKNLALKAELRKAFARLQETARVPHKYGVVAAGGRRAAYDLFCHEHGAAAADDKIVLLVDAEDLVTASTRWDHVTHRPGDGWACPSGATEDHLHFMAVVMETWLLANPQALAEVFPKTFKPSKIPQWPDAEKVPKATVNTTIQQCTGGYEKGSHSFKALEKVDVVTLRKRCPSADALFKALSE